MNDNSYYLPYRRFQELIDCLLGKGYLCIGPQVRDGAIVYDHLKHIDQLPWGIRDIQQPGAYSLEETDQKQAFAWANGPQAIKPHLFKPSESIWRVKRDENGKLSFESIEDQSPPMAILGAKACDIHAMTIQDKVFIDDYQDIRYKQRRSNLFIIAVSCTYSSANCFCVSAGGYPKAKDNFDLSMTELDDGFVIEIGTEQGQSILDQLNLTKAKDKQCQDVVDRVAQAAKSQTKTLPHQNSAKLRDVLFNNLEHPRWNDVADRCLSCGNCTLVCPTCFCSSETAQPNLAGDVTEHQRQWDSCFTAQHSYVHNKVIRDDTRKR